MLTVEKYLLDKKFVMGVLFLKNSIKNDGVLYILNYSNPKSVKKDSVALS